MKFAVTAQAFDRLTGAEAGPSRTEIIDVDTNPMFKAVRTSFEQVRTETPNDTLLLVKECYEAFWNFLNDQSQEIVFVSKIVPFNG